MKRALALFVAAGLSLPAAAFAQDTGDWPDLRGTWVGENEAVVWGKGEHHPHDGASDEPRRTVTEFTLHMQGQEGRRIWGEITSPHHKERVLGVIRFDKQSVNWVDDDGISTGRIVDADTIESCYFGNGEEAIIAACNTYKRQK